MNLYEPESTLGLAGTGAGCALATPVDLPQHPDEHRSKRPILLAVDQKSGEGALGQCSLDLPRMRDYGRPFAVGRAR